MRRVRFNDVKNGLILAAALALPSSSAWVGTPSKWEAEWWRRISSGGGDASDWLEFIARLIYLYGGVFFSLIPGSKRMIMKKVWLLYINYKLGFVSRMFGRKWAVKQIRLKTGFVKLPLFVLASPRRCVGSSLWLCTASRSCRSSPTSWWRSTAQDPCRCKHQHAATPE